MVCRLSIPTTLQPLVLLSSLAPVVMGGMTVSMRAYKTRHCVSSKNVAGGASEMGTAMCECEFSTYSGMKQTGEKGDPRRSWCSTGRVGGISAMRERSGNSGSSALTEGLVHVKERAKQLTLSERRKVEKVEREAQRSLREMGTVSFHIPLKWCLQNEESRCCQYANPRRKLSIYHVMNAPCIRILGKRLRRMQSREPRTLGPCRLRAGMRISLHSSQATWTHQCICSSYARCSIQPLTGTRWFNRLMMPGHGSLLDCKQCSRYGGGQDLPSPMS